VGIHSAGSASEPIDLKKDVKQGCHICHLLFNLCVDPLISHIKKFGSEGYQADGLEPATIQAYADDMVLLANWEENPQQLVNRAKMFFYFANILLNPIQYQVMAINSSRNDEGIVINGVRKKYVAKDGFIKYLDVPLGSRKIEKKKFLENKINKVFEEFNKLEYSVLAFNQMMKVIRSFITNKMNFIFANMFVPKGCLELIDKRIRKLINRFFVGKSIQKSFVYTNVRNGELGIPCMVDEYAA
jgi:hypothetical protein